MKLITLCVCALPLIINLSLIFEILILTYSDFTFDIVNLDLQKRSGLKYILQLLNICLIFKYIIFGGSQCFYYIVLLFLFSIIYLAKSCSFTKDILWFQKVNTEKAKGLNYFLPYKFIVFISSKGQGLFLMFCLGLCH